MENLAPTLRLCLTIRNLLESGEAIFQLFESQTGDFDPDLIHDLIVLKSLFHRGESIDVSKFLFKSPHRLAVYELIFMALEGQSILEALKTLEVEIKSECHHEIDSFVSKLPIYGLIPLLLFQFPAFLILLFGPILTFLKEALL